MCIFLQAVSSSDSSSDSMKRARGGNTPKGRVLKPRRSLLDSDSDQDFGYQNLFLLKGFSFACNLSLHGLPNHQPLEGKQLFEDELDEDQPFHDLGNLTRFQQIFEFSCFPQI